MIHFSRGILFLAALGLARLNAAPHPEVSLILSNMLERARLAASLTNLTYSYFRKGLMEQLDDAGKVETTEKKLFSVMVNEGRSTTRLMVLNDQPLPEPVEYDTKHSDRRRGFVLKPELVAKFEFKLTGTGAVSGRSCWRLQFAPRANLKDENIFEKVLHRMGGAIWVDQELYEISRLDVRLLKETSVFAGIAGALSTVKFRVERTPAHGDFWPQAKVFIEMKGRKLFSQFHFRYREECTEFIFPAQQPEEPPLQVAGE